MSIELRVLLFVGSLCTLLYFLYKIHKNQLQIEYATSWSIFSGVLLIISIFPGIAIWISQLLGFQSTANLVYLLIIFILIMKSFSNTIKMSRMNRQITELAQHIAIHEYQEKELPKKDAIRFG